LGDPHEPGFVGQRSGPTRWPRLEPAVQVLPLERHRPAAGDGDVELEADQLDRQSIYEAMKVPEIWRFDGKTLRVYRLHKNGRDRQSRTSAAFPFLPVHELVQFLQLDETTRMRWFVEWLREGGFRP
jgi:hypothetical protein